MIDSKYAARVLTVWVCTSLLAGFFYGVLYERYFVNNMSFCVAEPNKPSVCYQIPEEVSKIIMECQLK